MRGSLPDYVAEHLRTDHSFDLDSMTSHSFYLLLSTFSGIKYCPLIHSKQVYSLDNKNMMMELPYHDFDGSAFFTPRCVTHALILVV